MLKITLKGDLGAQFGKVHNVEVNSAHDAVKYLCIMKSGFKKKLLDMGRMGIQYIVHVDGKNVSDKEIGFNASHSVTIEPVLSGSKKAGLWQVISGAVLIIGGAALSYFSAGTAASIGGYMMATGASLALGGVIAMLSPQPNSDQVNNGRSENISGRVVTQQQGTPIQVVYGETQINPQYFSVGLYPKEKV